MKQLELEPTITERRRLTRNKIYRYILESREPVSKQQIAYDLDLSLPTVHQNITELLGAGLIRAGEAQKSTGGRPPVGYLLEQNMRYAVGVALTTNHLRFLVANLKCEQLAYKSVRLEKGDAAGEHLVEELEIFLNENGIRRDRVLGVGITIPGIFDSKTDSIVISPSLNVKNFSLKKMLAGCPYPIYIANDSTAGGLAEWLSRNAEERQKSFVYLLLENGVGGSIFLNGQMYEGDHTRSGEFGHMCIVPGGRTCNCGKKGCLEAYCGAFRFTRDIGLSIEEFFDGVHAGQSGLNELWNDVLEHLAIGIVNLRMAFDCDIVLGGFVSEYIREYLPRLREMIEERDPLSGKADFLSVSNNPNAAMLGASWHFITDFVDHI